MRCRLTDKDVVQAAQVSIRNHSSGSIEDFLKMLATLGTLRSSQTSVLIYTKPLCESLSREVVLQRPAEPRRPQRPTHGQYRLWDHSRRARVLVYVRRYPILGVKWLSSTPRLEIAMALRF